MPPLLSPGEPAVDEAVGDRSLVRAMLEAEAALAGAAADAGVLPRDAADALAAVCSELPVDAGTLETLADGARRAGTPVPALVALLAAGLDERARPWVHLGATSQDVLDTALVLVSRRGAALVARALESAADACAGLAREHRQTVMLGRTLGQPAEPTTFGRRAAGWLDGLDGALLRLHAAAEALPAQLGGAVGTRTGFGDAADEVAARFARRLGLPGSVLPWHTQRLRLLDLAAALAAVAQAAGKVAVDVLALAQHEVGEVSLAVTGGSSAMPHKRNPVPAVLVSAGVRQVPGLLASVVGAGVQEQERSAGGWQAEWPPWRELLHVTGGVAAQCRVLLESLQVHSERMRANLEALGGLPLAGSVAARLAPALGRLPAHELVSACADAAAATGRPFHEVLADDPRVRAHLSVAALAAALDPGAWLGAAPAMAERAVAEHQRLSAGWRGMAG